MLKKNCVLYCSYWKKKVKGIVARPKTIESDKGGTSDEAAKSSK